jgi:lipid-A-disaccharide synthase
VGNPLADGLRGSRDLPARALSGTLALLPGSRVQEVSRIWPAMLRAARMLRERHPELRLVVPVAPTIDHRLLGDPLDVELVDGKAPEVLARADAAIVASGTATLEAALALTPLVVVYRTSWLTWLIGRLLVRVRFVSLVNLLAGRAVVPELLQADCTPGRIAAAAEPLLSATPGRAAQLDALRAVRAQLLPQGSARAARRVAEEVLALVEGP